MLNPTNLSGMADEELLAAILEKPVVQELMAQYGSSVLIDHRGI